MRLLDRFGRSAPYLSDSSGLLLPSFLGYSRNGQPASESISGYDFQSYAQAGMGGNSIIFGLILARASLLSEASFKWRRQSDKALFGTADLALLETPWPNGTTGELIWRMEEDVSLAGNAYIRNDGDRLVRLRPDWVGIVLEVEELDTGIDERLTRSNVVGYTYKPGGVGETEFYPVADICHWAPYPDPLAEYRGMSWITPAVREVNADQAMTNHKQTFLEMGGTPNLVIKYNQVLSDAAFDMAKRQYDQEYAGPKGRRVMVLDQGADAQALGATLQSMDFTQVQAAGENRIAAAAGVPGIVVGLKEGLQAATYSNYQQAMRRFADLTGRPLWRSMCAALGSIVAEPPGARLWYDVSDIAALRQGEQEQAATNSIDAGTISKLITAGFEPESAVVAVKASDWSLLKHTGNIPTTLYPEGKEPGADTTTGGDTTNG